MKNIIKRLLNKNKFIYNVFYFFYALLFDYDGRQHRIKEGEKETYYIIRPRTNCIEGLLALFVNVVREIDYAKKNKYIPVVDMKNYKTQYYDGISNVWEWFFTQPGGTELDDIANTNTTQILSGYRFVEYKDEKLFSNEIFYNRELNSRCYRVINENFEFTDAVISLYNKEVGQIPINECIGVYIRGTDYVKLRPVGENIQPSVDMVVKKIEEFSNKYKNAPVYLVTEDFEIYTEICKAIRNEIFLVSYDTFITNYDGKNFLSKSNVFEKDGYHRGIEYLVKIMILSKCRYFVSSITCGSKVAYVLNNNSFSDEYIFDLGIYK